MTRAREPCEPEAPPSGRPPRDRQRSGPVVGRACPWAHLAAAVAAHRGRRPGCLCGLGLLRPCSFGCCLGGGQVVGVLAGEQTHEPGVSPDPELGRDARREALVLEPVHEVAPRRGDIAWDVADRAALDLDGDRPSVVDVVGLGDQGRRCAHVPVRLVRSGREQFGEHVLVVDDAGNLEAAARRWIPPAATRYHRLLGLRLWWRRGRLLPSMRRRNDTPKRPPFVFLGARYTRDHRSRRADRPGVMDRSLRMGSCGEQPPRPCRMAYPAVSARGWSSESIRSAASRASACTTWEYVFIVRLI